LGLVSIFAWVFLTSFIVWFILKKTVGIRVDEQQEYEGVDLSECGLEAYPEFTKAD
jgi:Amt family ammonium transporter